MDFLRAVSLTFFSVGIFWNAVGAFLLSRIGSIPINLMIILILGSFSGGYFGAHLSNLKGNKLIKKIIGIEIIILIILTNCSNLCKKLIFKSCSLKKFERY